MDAAAGAGEEGTLDKGDDPPVPSCPVVALSWVGGVDDSTEGVIVGLVGDLERLILAASRNISSGSSKRKEGALGPCTPGKLIRERLRRCGIESAEDVMSSVVWLRVDPTVSVARFRNGEIGRAHV